MFGKIGLVIIKPNGPGHPQMDKQGFTLVQLDQNIFAAPLRYRTKTAGQPLVEPIRQRPAQIPLVSLTDLIRCPDTTGSRAVRTVSTSGNSGTLQISLCHGCII